MRYFLHSRKRRGLTLLELTVVICVLLTLMGTGLFVSAKVKDWRMGREAAEVLRSVYTAQRMYLADHPTQPVHDLTMEALLPYLPVKKYGNEHEENPTIIVPTVTAPDGITQLEIRVDQSPPYLVDDPYSEITKQLWD